MHSIHICSKSGRFKTRVSTNVLRSSFSGSPKCKCFVLYYVLQSLCNARMINGSQSRMVNSKWIHGPLSVFHVAKILLQSFFMLQKLCKSLLKRPNYHVQCPQSTAQLKNHEALVSHYFRETWCIRMCLFLFFFSFSCKPLLPDSASELRIKNQPFSWSCVEALLEIL